MSSLAVVVVTIAALSIPAFADPEDDLRAAQQRANRAAAELSEAEEELAEAEGAGSPTCRPGWTPSALASTSLGPRSRPSPSACLASGGTVSITRLLRIREANDLVRAQQYSHVIAGGSSDSLRQYRAERENLREEQSALEEEREGQAASLENLRRRRAEAVEEIDELSRVLEQARAAEERDRQAEAAQAATQAAAAPTGADPSPSADSPASGGATDALAGGTPSSRQTPAATTPPAEPEPPADTGTEPEPPSESAAGWICPVQGPLAFSDDYGAPRGGGFRHQGNDILAPTGTPVVASVDGEVRHRSGAVSGLAYYLDGDDGTTYFGAHLDSYGASGRVSAGTVIGAVGATGDAAGGRPPPPLRDASRRERQHQPLPHPQPVLLRAVGYEQPSTSSTSGSLPAWKPVTVEPSVSKTTR